MLRLPPAFILFDTEYTTWEGALERGWNGPNEFREIVQIGAIRVDGDTLSELNSFSVFVHPKKNPILSAYFTELTGITQEKIDAEGMVFKTAMARFAEWCDDLHFYSFGMMDKEVLEANCKLENIPFPFDPSRFNNIREVFEKFGVSTEGYMSSTIIHAFGKEPVLRGHDALNDARSILDGLRELAKTPAPTRSLR